MRTLPTTFVLLFFTPLLIVAQDPKDEIKSKVIKSDSILILSHEKLRTDMTSGKAGFQRQVVIDNIPNKSIIIEQIKLDNASKEFLLKLFGKMKLDSVFNPNYCYDPHHSILFFENGKCSYIDICFGCKVFKITNDLMVDGNFLASDKDWTILTLFFTDRKINYKIKKD